MSEEETSKQESTNPEIESTSEDRIPSDNEIKSRIEYTLLLNPRIESDTIDVNVSDRRVTLEGSVDAFWKKREIKTLSANAKGVIGVTDKLEIVPPREYPDEEIVHELEKAIDRRPAVSKEDVDMKVSNGEVTLEGTVPNWFTYSQIKISSENTLGVVSVVDKIEIEA
jgi:osmotically-inducible protein OsmY